MTTTEDKYVFDFLVDEEKNVLLLLSSMENPPVEPAIVLLPETQSIEFFRDGNTHLSLKGIDSKVFAALADKNEVMVCETNATENPDETEIVYNYYALIVKK